VAVIVNRRAVSAGPRPAHPCRRQAFLLPRLGQEFVQCRDDLLTFMGQRFDKIAELLDGDGDYFERMQDDRRSAYLESRIEIRMTHFAYRRLSHQWNDNPAAVIVELGRLHNDNEGDGVFVPPGIPVHVELRH
jgi:hypothetical protein